MTRPRLLVCGAGLVLFGAIVAAAADVRVTPLVRDGRVWVSFGLADGFTDGVREAILSGLSITFSYDIELRRSRGAVARRLRHWIAAFALPALELAGHVVGRCRF